MSIELSIGDKVVIREDLANCISLDKCFIAPDMKKLAGTSATIVEEHPRDKNRYMLDTDGIYWYPLEAFERTPTEIYEL